MSSRARRTRSFSLPSVWASWSSIRWSMRACMSTALPNVIASSTSRRSWRATTGSRPRVAFARMICNDLSMIVRKWVSRVDSARCRACDTSRLAEAVPGLLGEERDVRVHALPEGVPRLCEELPRFRDVDAVPPGRFHVGARPLEDRLGPGILALGVRLLDRLGGQGPDLVVLLEGEGLAGVRKQRRRISDVPAPFQGVPDAGFRLVHARREDPLPALIEGPHGHPPEEAFRGPVVAARGQGPGLFDVPLERQGLDARLLRILEDRVRVLQGVRHAALPTDDVEVPPGGAGQGR